MANLGKKINSLVVTGAISRPYNGWTILKIVVEYVFQTVPAAKLAPCRPIMLARD
jgi:hypothetical protein